MTKPTRAISDFNAHYNQHRPHQVVAQAKVWALKLAMGGELGDGSPQCVALHCEAAALVVGKLESLLAKLLSQDADFLRLERDDLRLLASDPAGEGGEKELKGKKVNIAVRTVPLVLLMFTDYESHGPICRDRGWDLL